METILVVEDEVDVNNGICELLTSAGYEVLKAYDSEEALKILDNTIPDLVISDIMMPGKDGYQLLEEFQKRYGAYNIPFIFLTAKAYYDDIRTGMTYGADDYLIKPFKAKELLQAVQTRLKKSRKLKEFFNEIAGNISHYIPHELRTPLVAILGFNQLIIEQSEFFSKDEIVDMVKKIHSSLFRLHSRIEKFIVYSDVISTASNKMLIKEAQENFEKLDVANIISISADELAAKYKRINDLIYELEPCKLPTHELFLKIAVKELVENAIKFSNKNTPFTIKGKSNNNYYMISFENTPNVEFNLTNPRKIAPFFQQNRDEQNQIGNGLGLPIAEAALNILGAKFNIEKKSDKIVAKITLPVKPL